MEAIFPKKKLKGQGIDNGLEKNFFLLWLKLSCHFEAHFSNFSLCWDRSFGDVTSPCEVLTYIFNGCVLQSHVITQASWKPGT